MADQVAVNFNQVQRAIVVDQPAGERAETRADLHQMIADAWVDCVTDAFEHLGIGKKVLSEPLAGMVRAHFQCRLAIAMA